METKEIKRGGFFIFLLGMMAYTFSYVGRMNFSACLNSMVGAGLFTMEFGGYISTAYMITYGSGQLLNGIFGRYLPSKPMVFGGLFGAGCMNLLMGIVGDKFAIMTVWALNGLFMSMLWAPIIKAFAEWIEEKDRKSYTVYLSVSIPLGTILSYLIPAICLKDGSYNSVFVISSGFLFFAAFVWLFGMVVLKKYTKYMDGIFSKRKQVLIEAVGTKLSLGSITFKYALFAVMIGVMFNGALKDALTAWVPSYICTTFSLSDSFSATISIIIPLVTVFGAFVAVRVDKKFFNNELHTSASMFFVSFVSILPIMLTSRIGGEIGGAITTLLLAVAISSMWGVNTMFLSIVPYRFADFGMASSVTGLLNAFAYFSSALCSSLYGIIANGGGWNTVVIVWILIAFVGASICTIGGFAWKKRLVSLPK